MGKWPIAPNSGLPPNNAHEFIYICVHKSWNLWMKYGMVKSGANILGRVDFVWKCCGRAEGFNEWKQFKGSDNIRSSGCLNKLWWVCFGFKRSLQTDGYYAFFGWGAVARFRGANEFDCDACHSIKQNLLTLTLLLKKCTVSYLI